MSPHRLTGFFANHPKPASGAAAEPSAAPLPPPHFLTGFQAVPAAPAGTPWGLINGMLSLYQWAYAQALLNARPRWLRDDWFSQN